MVIDYHNHYSLDNSNKKFPKHRITPGNHTYENEKMNLSYF